MFWDGWRSLLEDRGKSWRPLGFPARKLCGGAGQETHRRHRLRGTAVGDAGGCGSFAVGFEASGACSSQQLGEVSA